MSSGSRRSLVPPALRDLSLWRSPDEEALDRSTLDLYLRRKRAVEMYLSAQSYVAIRATLGMSPQEVRRLVGRCTVSAADGSTFGFAALVPGVRVEGYNRTAPVKRSLGSGSGGCAGALTMLFKRMPELREYIEDIYLKRGKGLHNAHISYRDLHGSFLTKLREFGIGEHDWPFSTKDCGYKSLRKYCVSLLNDDPSRWVRARGGIPAARRTSVGSGTWPIIPVMRGMTTCQLDFHKVDAESVIIFETSDGARLPLPVARWHIGLLVEERWGLVLGAFIALEKNPSGDSVLEVVESALRPANSTSEGLFCALTVDGKVLPNQLLPELGHLGFSILKMDNAWSNAATEVVDNIIRTVGCAINYGPVRAWWRRSLIEQIFGHLTRRGLQRLPSTVGSNPQDPVKHNPTAQAKKFEITSQDLRDVVYGCIREHNETRSERIGFATPMSALANCFNKPGSSVFSQPLPLPIQENLKLLTHTEIVTVLGNAEKNIRPYVNLGRWKYTSDRLASSYHLVGRKLILYCDRRDVQNVHATVLDTGEQLGQIYAPHKFSHLKLTWRERVHMNNAGLALKQRENGQSPISRWLETRNAKLKGRKKGKKSGLPSRTEALKMAGAALAKSHSPQATSSAVEPVQSNVPVRSISLIPGMPQINVGNGVTYGI